MIKIEGIYEIVETNTIDSSYMVGRWVVFPFSTKTEECLKLLYTKEMNEINISGEWLITSKVRRIIIEPLELKIETEDITYTFEKVI